MSFPNSPRLLPAAEISESGRPQEGQEGGFRVGLPVSPHTSFTPPPPCEKDMSLLAANQAIVPLHSSRTQHASMVSSPAAMQWSTQGHFTPYHLPRDTPAFGVPTYFSPNSAGTDFLQNVQSGQFTTNYPLRDPLRYTSTSPRGHNGVDFSGTSGFSASYPPTSMFHCPPSDLHLAPSLPETFTPEPMPMADDYDSHYADFLRNGGRAEYASPFSGTSRASTPYSTSYDEDGPIDKEQPYAQLIYRALLTAPQHTMVLRDIYDWFRTYTDKASHSETKGWQNSIRHNLSMNGVSDLAPPDNLLCLNSTE
ncbi:hypothetical protein OPT61_g10121 [Boeremia exigua]|uniref:Uncharacterized protein n=1 Tax=Boeremia exigua TaxID=749465 RepID=A0ACC2HRK4_9PLEO|nr:hypothetical protein OPT61_g10121 [Boeremia exigua]